MNKTDFLSSLRAELTAREYPEETFASYMEQMERFFSAISDQDFEKKFVNNEKEIEKISDYIGNLIEKSNTYDVDNNIRPDAFIESNNTSSDKDDIDPSEAYTIQFDPAVFDDAVRSNDFVLNLFDEDAKTKEGAVINLTEEERINEIAEKTFKPSAMSKKKIKFEALDIESTRSSPLFWTVMILTIPVTLPIAIILIALFAVVCASIAIMIASFFVTLIAVVAAGTVSSAAIIIFGILQTFSEFYSGIFEIGIGITMIGATLFSGIVLYNIAVRLLPFIIKNWSKLYRFIIKKIRRMIYHFRKESARR